PSTIISTLSLHDALPISKQHSGGFEPERPRAARRGPCAKQTFAHGRQGDQNGIMTPHAFGVTADRATQRQQAYAGRRPEHVEGRSEEHTSELQSRENLVC